MNTIKIKHYIGMVLTGILVITVVACAEYKIKDDGEVVIVGDDTVSQQDVAQITVQTHTSSDAMAAINESKLVVKRAEEVGGLWRDTLNLIKQANAALEKNDHDKAHKMATIAKDQAEMALNQSYLEKANHMIGRIKELAKRDDMELLDRVTESEMAYLNYNGEKAYAMSIAMLEAIGNPKSAKPKPAHVASKVVSSKPRPKAPLSVKPVLFDSLPEVVDHDDAMEKQMAVERMESNSAPAAVDVSVTKTNKMDMDDQYKVASGDSLWKISAKPAVYSNPYQWPLIYKTNKKIIHDPDLIRPGQLLKIDREASEAEINAAVNHAKSRGAWSLGEKEEFDQVYLSGGEVAAR